MTNGSPFGRNVRRMEQSRGYGAGGEHAEKMLAIDEEWRRKQPPKPENPSMWKRLRRWLTTQKGKDR